jgi:hypothetical protein
MARPSETPLSATSPLLPRYRRPLTFGAILDETFQIYRRAWIMLVAAGALLAVPYVLATSLAGRAISGGLSVGLGFVIFWLLALAVGAAVLAMIDSLIRGERQSLERACTAAFTRVLPLAGASLVFFLALVLLSVLAIPLFVLGAFGLLGGLVALVGIIVWAANPTARRPWLKWLIVFGTPFGLPVYFSMRWSFFSPAVVLERAGPIEALRRSGELLRGHWFRAWGVSLVVGAIATILQSSLGFLVGLTVGIAAVPTAGTSQGLGIAEAAANFMGAALFGTIPIIATTLLFVDLRNRHEGADLAERLEQLEAGVPTTV